MRSKESFNLLTARIGRMLAGCMAVGLGMAASAQVQVTVIGSPPFCTLVNLTLQATGLACDSGTPVQWTLHNTNGGSDSTLSSLPSSPCELGWTFGPGCWDISVSVDGGPFQTFANLFCVEQPMASFTVSDASICEGDCITLTSTSTSPASLIDSWVWSGVPQAPAPGTSSFISCISDAGTYSPQLTVFANGCPATVVNGPEIVVSDNYPTATITPSSILDCPGAQLINLSTSPMFATTTWSVLDANGGTVCEGTSNALACAGLPEGDYTAHLTVENAEGCSDATSIPITIFDEPALSITMNASCAGTCASYSAVATPAPAQSITWTVLDANNVSVTAPSGASGSCYSFPSGGTYTVSATATYSSTCSITEQIQVVVQEPPVAAMGGLSAGGDTLLCGPSCIEFTNLSTGVGALSYEWRVNGDFESNAPSPTLCFSNSSNVTLEVTDAQGCTATDSYTVTIDPPELTLAYIGGDCAEVEICPEIEELVIIPGESISTWEWAFGDGETSDEESPCHSYANEGTYNICLTITTENGCTASACRNVIISPALNPAFGTIPQERCAGLGVVFDAVDITGTDYVWRFLNDSTCDGLSANMTFNTGSTPSVGALPNAQGCYDVILTISNAGCEARDTVLDAVCFYGPIVRLESIQNCVTPFEVEFETTCLTSDADSLEWDFNGDGIPDLGGSADDPALNNPTWDYSPNGEGTYEVSVTAFPANYPDTCSYTRYLTVYIDDPSANLSFTPTSGCPPLCVEFEADNEPFVVEWNVDFGNGDTLQASAAPLSTPPDLDDYQYWSGSYRPSGPYINSWNSTFAGGPFIACVNYTNTGDYIITAIATNIHGCIDTMVFADTISISTSPDFATFTSTVTKACDTLCVSVTANNALSLYQWSYRTLAWGNWIGFGSDSSAAQLCLPSVPAFLEVRLNGEQGTCSDSQVLAVDIPALATASFTLSDATPCQGQEVTFSATGAGATGHAWAITGPAGDVVATGSGTPFTPSPSPFTAAGIYTVCLAVEDAAWGCPDTLCQTLEVHVPDCSVDVTLIPVGCYYQVSICPEQVVPGSTYHYTIRRTYPLPEEVVWEQTVSSASSCATSGFLPYGVYDLVVTVTGPGGWNDCEVLCTTEDILGLGDVLGPWTWEPLDSVNCAPYCVRFAVHDTTQTDYTYVWNFGDCSGTITGPVVEHCYTLNCGMSPPFYITPSVQVVFPNGCGPFFYGDTITVLPYEVSATTVGPICTGDTATVEFTPDTTVFGIHSISFDPNTAVHAGPPWQYGLHPAVSTTYQAIATYHQCKDTVEVVVPVNPLPTLSAQSYGPFCINEGPLLYPDVTPVPLPGDSAWTVPAYFPDPMAIGVGCDTITYTYTDSNGCSNAVDIPFCINDTTLVEWVGDLNICRNAAPLPLAELMDLVSLPGGNFEANCGSGWQPITSFDPNTCPANYTDCPALVPVRYTYMNADGCTSVIDTTITVHPVPVPAFSFNQAVLCAGDSVQPLDASTIACGNISGWHWEVEGYGNHATQDPGWFTFLPANAWHAVTLTATSSTGCSASITDSVFVNPLPVLTPEAYGPFCCNDPGPLPLPTVNPGQGSFTEPPCWSTPGGCCGSSSTITYTYTDAIGCTDSIPIPFTIHDTTLVTWSPDTNLFHLCRNGAPLPLMPLVSHPGGSFEVNCGNGWVAATTFDPATCSPYLACPEVPLRYTYPTAGCISVIDTLLYVHPLPEPEFTTEDVCAYDPLAIVNTSSIACGSVTDWNWVIPGTGNFSTQAVGPYLLAPDTLSITLTATSNRGCTASFTDTVIVHPAPVAQFTIAHHCQDSVAFVDLSSIAWNAGVDLIDQWSWDFGPTALPSTSLQQHPVTNYPDWAPAFQVELMVSSTFGCSDSAVDTTAVHPQPVNSMAFTPNCLGDSTEITSTSTIPQGSIDSTWWTVETAAHGYTGTAITHAFSSSPPFHHPITLYTESDQGCIAVTDTQIEIFPLPQVEYNLSQQEFCAHGTVLFSDASQVPPPYQNADWHWYVNDSLQGMGQSLELAFPEEGTYDIALVVTTANGCTDTLLNAGQLTVHPLPVAGFAADPAHTDIYRTEIQFHDSSQGAQAWAYLFGDGPLHDYHRNPVHQYATFGRYVVEQVVTNAFGCTDTAYAMVIIDPDLIIHVPNTFTPDGDGINDIFKPVLAGFDVREYNFTIWNRWGELIFETNDEHQAWDGRRGGTSVQDGVYVWQVELLSPQFTAPKLLRGHVTVLR